METFILTWNPDDYGEWSGWVYDREVHETAVGRIVEGDWSTGNRKKGVTPGDRFYLLRQRRDRGIVASAEATSGVLKVRSHRDRRKNAWGVDLEFDHIVHVDDRLRVEDLKSKVPGVVWDNLQASGTIVSKSSAGLLEDLWARHLNEDRPTKVWLSPDEEGGGFKEGAVRQVLVNQYERDIAARSACIEHYGCTCQVCGLDFSQQYGEIGHGFIHVHHLKPLAKAGRRRKVDPIRDLRPVCPNCHAMLHSGGKVRTPEALQKVVKRRF